MSTPTQPMPLPFSWADQEQHLVSHLSALIRLDTSNPPGNEIAAARYLSRELSRSGIAHTVLESEPGRANLVARLPGSGQEPPLMLLGHADVVGAQPDQWNRPPFSGEVADGRVWGRGALDMKGQVAASLLVMQLLAAHRIPLSRDLLLVVTADEEAGSRLGAYWLWENHRSLVEAEWAFNEGGGQRFVTPGGPVYTVQVAEKGSARMRVTARGQGGHASVPRADTAIFTLAEALLRLRAFSPQSVLHPAARRMLHTLADLHPGAGAQAIERLLKEPTWAGANSLPIDPVLREFVVAGLHNTATATILSAGQRQNVVPVEASVVLDGRLLPGELPDRWMEEVQKALGDRVAVSLLHGRMSHRVHDDPRLLRVLGDTVAAHDPDARVLPYINPASTDARAFPDMNVVGFFPSASDADIMRLIHAPDEHARITDLMFGGKCLLDAVLRLSI
ncbi:M20/M25/M40 family metallo-hydrolase [Streptomyces sp. ISL-66]|uniref:M20/M25/M40 family metallo-hydrolase n=1 Tax=Streptomyces sp. ISL-66 TaxID=2819186 RepID=UPI001BE8792F|nr:M20/M25/M40 family metallo-hydrolase [Streptomyces sp. ISL-66]MBT2469335.1 M20/M25/M40 family metallo-hydrolase [Streptomyces sp. ISL-66]